PNNEHYPNARQEEGAPVTTEQVAHRLGYARQVNSCGYLSGRCPSADMRLPTPANTPMRSAPP
ncbi:MAG: hypothetical protein ACRDQ7_04675, partial [Haloechinothrix sp.]